MLVLTCCRKKNRINKTILTTVSNTHQASRNNEGRDLVRLLNTNCSISKARRAARSGTGALRYFLRHLQQQQQQRRRLNTCTARPCYDVIRPCVPCLHGDRCSNTTSVPLIPPRAYMPLPVLMSTSSSAAATATVIL